MKKFGERETYTLIDNSKQGYGNKPKIKINNEGANIIWAAYYALYGDCQKMDTREDRGGIAYLSELEIFKKDGVLAQDFNYKDYIINNQ